MELKNRRLPRSNAKTKQKQKKKNKKKKKKNNKKAMKMETTINADKRFVIALREVVKGAGNHFLAGSTLTCDENG